MEHSAKEIADDESERLVETPMEDAPTSLGGARRSKWLDHVLNNDLSLKAQFAILILILVFEAFIFTIDLETDPSISFAPVYSLIVLMAAFLMELRFSFIAVAATIVLRIYALRENFPDNVPFHYIENLIITCLCYVIFTFLVRNNKALIVRLRRHARRVSARRRLLAQRRRLMASIRRALPQDVDQIVKLILLESETGAFDEGNLEADRLSRVAPTLREAILTGQGLRNLWQGGTGAVPVEYWVVSLNGDIVAFMMVIGIDPNDKMGRELHLMAVAPSHRGLGLGGCMIDFFVEHYRQRRLLLASKPMSTMWNMAKRRRFAFIAHTKAGYDLMQRID